MSNGKGAPHPRACSHQHYAGWLCRIASAVREIPSENEVWKHTKMRTSKYLSNLVEQDHRGIKSRAGPMLGFKHFDYAAITIAGVELLRRIHKGQFALGPLRLKDQAVPAIWNAVQSA
jgi:transposase-like protein